MRWVRSPRQGCLRYLGKHRLHFGTLEEARQREKELEKKKEQKKKKGPEGEGRRRELCRGEYGGTLARLHRYSELDALVHDLSTIQTARDSPMGSAGC